MLVTHDHEDHGAGAAALRRPGARAAVCLAADGRDPCSGDGQRFAVPGADLEAVHTPGHSADHVVFFERTNGALFTGDAVLGHGERASSTRRTAI